MMDNGRGIRRLDMGGIRVGVRFIRGGLWGGCRRGWARRCMGMGALIRGSL
jgi:hypothetical protein